MIRCLLLIFILACPAACYAQAQLAVVDAYFEDADRRVIRDQKLPAGDTLYLSFRVAGFKQNEQRKILLNWWVECDDPHGKPLAEVASEKIDTTLTREDEKWRPKVDWSMVIPNYVPSGEYVVLIRVRDEIASKETALKMPFQVRGIDVEPSDKLTVRGFEFLESDEGKPKASAVFATPSTLWARFRIVGFVVNPEKQIVVQADLSILDSEGKVVFSRPQAADESLRVFYPPRFLTETFNLELQKGIKPGEYTIRLDLRDVMGKQQAQYETKFRIT